MKPLHLSWPGRLVLALAMAALAVAASHWHWFWTQDEAVYDTYVGGWDYPPDPRLLIVAIDDASLQQLGQWPWPRATHARLLDRLTQAGAGRVALDLMLSEPDRRDAAQDAELAAAIRRNGKVVLPVLAAPSSGPRMAEELLPIPLIAANAATLGHSDIEVDADGVAAGCTSLPASAHHTGPRWDWRWPMCAARCPGCAMAAPTSPRRTSGGATITCGSATPARRIASRRCPMWTCSTAPWTRRCCAAGW